MMPRGNGRLDEPFPIDELLDLLGAPVSRLLLLDHFTDRQAQEFSDNQFSRAGGKFFAELVFVRNPVTGVLRPRRTLEEDLLNRLVQVHPHAAVDFAERLITLVIGSEILDTRALMNWMLLNRQRPVARAAIAGVAAYSPFEIIGSLVELQARASDAPPLHGLFQPYSITADRWQRALTEESAMTRPLATLDQLARVSNYHTRTPFPVTSPATAPRRPEFRGYLPVDLKLNPLKRHTRRGINVRSDARSTLTTTRRETSTTRSARILSAGHEDRETFSQTSHEDWAPFNTGGPVSESTTRLLLLVLADRGPTQIGETLDIDFTSRSMKRRCTVTTSSSEAVQGILFVHLGSIPSSAGQTLPLTARAIGDDKLVSGAGPIVSTYISEMTTVLSDLARRPTDGLTASDWSRVDRSIREPWRFIHTTRSYVDLSAVTVEWTEEITPTEPTMQLWPFDGAAYNRYEIEGSRYGNDDIYTVAANVTDSRRISSFEMDTIPRPQDTTNLEAPALIQFQASWPRSSLFALLLITLVGSISLLAIAVASIQGSLFDVDFAGLTFGLSVFSTLVSPVVAYITASSMRSDASGAPGPRNEIAIRLAMVLLLVIVLAVATLLASSRELMGGLFAFLDVGVALFLTVSAAISVGTRISQSHRLTRSAQERSSTSRRTSSWNLSETWTGPLR